LIFDIVNGLQIIASHFFLVLFADHGDLLNVAAF
jgi:hypothetical protein